MIRSRRGVQLLMRTGVATNGRHFAGYCSMGGILSRFLSEPGETGFAFMRQPGWLAFRIHECTAEACWRDGEKVRLGDRTGEELADFHVHFNRHRVHSSLGGDTPAEVSGDSTAARAELSNFGWQSHCRGLYQLPMAA